MPLLPNRRWLRFSIRTLLVAVTLLCVWLGWQWRLVQERRSLLQLIAQRDYPRLRFQSYTQPALPWIRQLLGDELLAGIYVMDGSLRVDEKRQIEAAFPEASVAVLDVPLLD